MAEKRTRTIKNPGGKVVDPQIKRGPDIVLDKKSNDSVDTLNTPERIISDPEWNGLIRELVYSAPDKFSLIKDINAKELELLSYDQAKSRIVEFLREKGIFGTIGDAANSISGLKVNVFFKGGKYRKTEFSPGIPDRKDEESFLKAFYGAVKKDFETGLGNKKTRVEQKPNLQQKLGEVVARLVSESGELTRHGVWKALEDAEIIVNVDSKGHEKLAQEFSFDGNNYNGSQESDLVNAILRFVDSERAKKKPKDSKPAEKSGVVTSELLTNLDAARQAAATYAKPTGEPKVETKEVKPIELEPELDKIADKIRMENSDKVFDRRFDQSFETAFKQYFEERFIVRKSKINGGKEFKNPIVFQNSKYDFYKYDVEQKIRKYVLDKLIATNPTSPQDKVVKADGDATLGSMSRPIKIEPSRLHTNMKRTPGKPGTDDNGRVTLKPDLKILGTPGQDGEKSDATKTSPVSPDLTKLRAKVAALDDAGAKPEDDSQKAKIDQLITQMAEAQADRIKEKAATDKRIAELEAALLAANTKAKADKTTATGEGLTSIKLEEDRDAELEAFLKNIKQFSLGKITSFRHQINKSIAEASGRLSEMTKEDLAKFLPRNLEKIKREFEDLDKKFTFDDFAKKINNPDLVKKYATEVEEERVSIFTEVGKFLTDELAKLNTKFSGVETKPKPKTKTETDPDTEKLAQLRENIEKYSAQISSQILDEKDLDERRKLVEALDLKAFSDGVRDRVFNGNKKIDEEFLDKNIAEVEAVFDNMQEKLTETLGKKDDGDDEEDGRPDLRGKDYVDPFKDIYPDGYESGRPTKEDDTEKAQNPEVLALLKQQRADLLMKRNKWGVRFFNGDLRRNYDDQIHQLDLQIADIEKTRKASRRQSRLQSIADSKFIKQQDKIARGINNEEVRARLAAGRLHQKGNLSRLNNELESVKIKLKGRLPSTERTELEVQKLRLERAIKTEKFTRRKERLADLNNVQGLFGNVAMRFRESIGNPDTYKRGLFAAAAGAGVMALLGATGGLAALGLGAIVAKGAAAGALTNVGMGEYLRYRDNKYVNQEHEERDWKKMRMNLLKGAVPGAGGGIVGAALTPVVQPFLHDLLFGTVPTGRPRLGISGTADIPYTPATRLNPLDYFHLNNIPNSQTVFRTALLDNNDFMSLSARQQKIFLENLDRNIFNPRARFDVKNALFDALNVKDYNLRLKVLTHSENLDEIIGNNQNFSKTNFKRLFEMKVGGKHPGQSFFDRALEEARNHRR